MSLSTPLCNYTEVLTPSLVAIVSAYANFNLCYDEFVAFSAPNSGAISSPTGSLPGSSVPGNSSLLSVIASSPSSVPISVPLSNLLSIPPPPFSAPHSAITSVSASSVFDTKFLMANPADALQADSTDILIYG